MPELYLVIIATIIFCALVFAWAFSRNFFIGIALFCDCLYLSWWIAQQWSPGYVAIGMVIIALGVIVRIVLDLAQGEWRW